MQEVAIVEEILADQLESIALVMDCRGNYDRATVTLHGADQRRQTVAEDGCGQSIPFEALEESLWALAKQLVPQRSQGIELGDRPNHPFPQ
jgi:hypothetical protein